MTGTRASRTVAAWLEQEGDNTQKALAERLSRRVGRAVSQSTVSQIARGRQQPRADLIAAFRVELGIEVEAWLPDSADDNSAA